MTLVLNPALVVALAMLSAYGLVRLLVDCARAFLREIREGVDDDG